jgi:hypothetical protein
MASYSIHLVLLLHPLYLYLRDPQDKEGYVLPLISGVAKRFGGADRPGRHLCRGGKLRIREKNATVNLSFPKNFASVFDIVLLVNRPLLRIEI